MRTLIGGVALLLAACGPVAGPQAREAPPALIAPDTPPPTPRPGIAIQIPDREFQAGIGPTPPSFQPMAPGSSTGAWLGPGSASAMASNSVSASPSLIAALK